MSVTGDQSHWYRIQRPLELVHRMTPVDTRRLQIGACGRPVSLIFIVSPAIPGTGWASPATVAWCEMGGALHFASPLLSRYGISLNGRDQSDSERQEATNPLSCNVADPPSPAVSTVHQEQEETRRPRLDADLFPLCSVSPPTTTSAVTSQLSLAEARAVCRSCGSHSCSVLTGGSRRPWDCHAGTASLIRTIIFLHPTRGFGECVFQALLSLWVDGSKIRCGPRAPCARTQTASVGHTRLTYHLQNGAGLRDVHIRRSNISSLSPWSLLSDDAGLCFYATGFRDRD